MPSPAHPALSPSISARAESILQSRLLQVALVAAFLCSPSSASEIWAWGDIRVLPRPVKSLGGGTEMAIAVLDDGRVVSWGSNVTPAHRAPADMGPARKAVGGTGNILALLEDGTVRVWGDSLASSLPPSGLDHVVDIAAADKHFLALTDDGKVVGWGSNAHGESAVPAGLSEVVAIAAGSFHSLALTKEGGVVAWGDTTFGKSTVPPLNRKAVSIAAGYNHSLAVLEDGSVVGWGRTGGILYSVLPVPNSVKNAVAVYANNDFSVVLRGDGNIVAWGDNGFHQLEPPSDARDLHGLALGSSHVFGFRADGSVVGWGSRYKGLSSAIYWFKEPLGEVSQIKASAGAVFALSSDGKIHGAGYNFRNILDIPNGMGSVKSIALGEAHGLALLHDGTVQAWGDTAFGKTKIPNGLKNVASVLAGGNQSAAILQDGRIIRWGDTSATLPSSELRVRKLSLGYQHLLMIDSSGTLLGSGGNRFGETQAPATYGPIADISTGATISMLRESGDTVRVWGRVKVPGAYIRGVKDMAAGAVHALALSSEGKIYGWGENYYGQASVPNEINDISQISAGLYNSVALVKSPVPSVSSRKAPHTSLLAPGEYQISIVSVNGVQIWEGRSNWNGKAWDLPRLRRGVGFVLVKGSPRGSFIHP